MKIKELLLISVFLLGGLFIYNVGQKAVPQLGGEGASYRWNYASTTTVTINTVVTSVVTQNGQNHYIAIQNHSNPTIFCALDGDISAANSQVTSTASREIGFRISSSTSNLQGQGNLWEIWDYSGNINCTASANTTSTLIIGR